MSKITKEELKELQELQGKLNAIKHDLGLLQTQQHSLLHMYAEEIAKQEEAKKKLEESKYSLITMLIDIFGLYKNS